MPALRIAAAGTLAGTPGQPAADGFPGITDGAATAPSVVGSRGPDPSPLQHAATWIAIGAAAWLVVLYVHFHTY